MRSIGFVGKDFNYINLLDLIFIYKYGNISSPPGYTPGGEEILLETNCSGMKLRGFFNIRKNKYSYRAKYR